MLNVEIDRGFVAPTGATVFERNNQYFAEQLVDNNRWASRMGLQLQDVFRPGARVLDFGCGHGALAVEGARLGARVTGIDTSAARIGFAARKAATEYPELAERLKFLCCRVQDVAGEACFDAILSKDTFEHVADIDGVLVAFRRLLAPGGRVYLGFSPLWYSPFGDHGFLTRRRVPWLHLLLGDRRFLTAHNTHTGRPDRDVEQAGFNRLTPRNFRAAFEKHGFAVERMRVNPGGGIKRVLGAPLAALRHIPPLEAYATIGLYLTLRREL